MAIEFYGKEIEAYERKTSLPYVGFFTSNGKLVDYNTELGGNHRSLGNIVSWTYLLWIKNSNAFEYLGIRDIC